ncbi:hypothetical protein MAIT1_02453 [Magnetofaba australis IT-1]|uniref:Uncharacterized protein n=2 Tax=Magnetofaba TaxID=1472292 RepID=A0A1Y2K3S4_9PROT|nr:hypothetical protein MAIT1_02453 [Magnetofaba australis IT-1]
MNTNSLITIVGAVIAALLALGFLWSLFKTLFFFSALALMGYLYWRWKQGEGPAQALEGLANMAREMFNRRRG